MKVPGCVLCEGEGGVRVASGERWRIIRVDEPGFPAFYRVVWNEHVREFSDLSADHRRECMDVVVAVEQALRRHLAPTKINVASLGNMVDHLHWHVIARFAWDTHFPGAVWAAAQREPDAGRLAAVSHALPNLDRTLADGLLLS